MKQKLILAFSGGRDSRFLLEIITRFTERTCHAVFFQSPFVSPETFKNTCSFLEEMEINYTIIPVDLLKNPSVTKNGRDRCYHCKRLMFETLFRYFNYPSEILRFMEGTNFSEAISENRPGLRAVEELGIESPLRQAGLTEDDIAILSKTYQMTGEADDIGCLATRIPFGVPITEEILKKIDESEDPLRREGMHPVRVRYFGKTARIEAGGETVGRLFNNPFRDRYIRLLNGLGFSNIFVDLRGYRKGALAEDADTRENP